MKSLTFDEIYQDLKSLEYDYLQPTLDRILAEEPRYIENFNKVFANSREFVELIDDLSARKDQMEISELVKEIDNPSSKKLIKKYDIEYDELILTNAYNHQEKADICLEKNITEVFIRNWKLHPGTN